MSLDYDTGAKKGVTSAGTFATGLASAAITDAQIAAGDMSADNCVKVFIDTSAGNVDVDAAAVAAVGALTGIEEGDKIMYVKSTADTNVITFTDPDGVVYDFVDRQSEYICLVWDGAALQIG